MSEYYKFEKFADYKTPALVNCTLEIQDKFIKLEQQLKETNEENEKLKEQLEEIKSYLPKVSESSYAKLVKQLEQSQDDWCKKHEQQLELMEKLTQLDKKLKETQEKLKTALDEIAYLENRLKSEFDAGYKLGVKEGMNEIEKLRKLLQAFKPN